MSQTYTNLDILVFSMETHRGTRVPSCARADKNMQMIQAKHFIVPGKKKNRQICFAEKRSV
jgi:hypothetical protein